MSLSVNLPFCSYFVGKRFPKFKYFHSFVLSMFLDIWWETFFYHHKMSQVYHNVYIDFFNVQQDKNPSMS